MYQGMPGGIFEVGGSRGGFANGKFHVRLPRSEPHLAHIDAVDAVREVAGLYSQFKRAACPAGTEANLETAVGIGLRGILLAAPFHGNACKCLSRRAAQGKHPAPLHHHAVGNHRRHDDTRRLLSRGSKETSEAKRGNKAQKV